MYINLITILYFIIRKTDNNYDYALKQIYKKNVCK